MSTYQVARQADCPAWVLAQPKAWDGTPAAFANRISGLNLAAVDTWSYGNGATAIGNYAMASVWFILKH